MSWGRKWVNQHMKRLYNLSLTVKERERKAYKCIFESEVVLYREGRGDRDFQRMLLFDEIAVYFYNYCVTNLNAKGG